MVAGNNPMAGMTAAVAVSIEEAAEKDFCIHKKSLKDQVHICMTIQRICRIGFINVFPGLLKST